MRYPATLLWPEGTAHKEVNPCIFASMPLHPHIPLLLRHEHYMDGLDTGLHQHMDFYAFYIVQNGQGIHLIDGHPYTIVRGDVYLLPPGTIHAYQRYRMLEIDAFYFQRQFFSLEEVEALRALPSFWQLFLAAENASDTYTDYTHRLHLSPERHQATNEILTEICAEYVTPELAAALLTHSQFFRLLVSVTRYPVPERKAATFEPDHTYSTEITHVLRICEERFQESLTVPQLAALLFLSPSHFSELFLREVGVPPATYLRRLRLERAQTLLRSTTLTVTEIAQQVGFSDGPHLTRAFQAAFHLTPTAYRAAFGLTR